MMKKYFLILIIFFGWSTLSKAQNGVTVEPKFPMPGDSVFVTYSPGKKVDQIPVLHFTYSNFFELPQKMEMQPSGSNWRVAIKLPKYAVLATFVIEMGDIKIAPSDKRHYQIVVYNKKRQRVEKSYLYEGYSLSAQEGRSPLLAAHQAKQYREELKHYPGNYEAKLRLLNYEISIAPEQKKKQLYDQANEVIAKNFYNAPGDMGTTNLTTMGYLIIGEKSRLDSLRKVIKVKYPNTEAGYELRIDDITALKDSVKMVSELEDLLNSENRENTKFLTTAHNILFSYYARKGDKNKTLHHLSFLDKGFTPYKPMDLKNQATILYRDSVALDTAFALAMRSLSYADTFPISLIRFFPETGYLPSYITREQRKESVKNVTEQLQSLMALILQKQGKKDEALHLMKTALQTSTDNETFRNAGMFFANTHDYQSAFNAYKNASQYNPYDTLSYQLMKTYFKKWNGSAAGLEKYEKEIDKYWMAQLTGELQKELISKPLPDVLSHYVDLKGNPVSANLIKNKIVVMDFWATWCIPCMEAMPYMEQVYEKYRSDPDVVFMIVNSGSKNELSDAQNWWGNKKYSFPVYYNQDRTIGDRLNFPAIPATFVIDQSGNIRFQTIGFEGEGMTRTLTAKIEMLKKK